MRHKLKHRERKAEKYQWSLNDNIKQSNILDIRVMKREERKWGDIMKYI